MDLNSKVNVCGSEFGKQNTFGTMGYDRSTLIKEFDKLFETSQPEGQNEVVFLSENREIEKHFLNLYFGYEDNSESLKQLRVIDRNDEFYEVTKHVAKLLSQREHIQKQLDDKIWFSYNTALDYVNAFLELSKEIVFNPENDNLYNTSFRKSNFLQNLILFGTKYNSHNDSHIFSFYNPIVQENLRRIFANINMFLKSSEKQDDLLFLLKKQLLLRCAENSFIRFISCAQKTHRVSLNRHNSQLLSWPYQELSSVEEIKPIRLFEKIVSHISNNIDLNSTEYILRICIVGHTECSENHKEKELCDLMSAILGWYDRFGLDADNKPLLSIEICNYVNKKDWPNSNEYRCFKTVAGTECFNFSLESQHNIAKCVIYPVNYSDYFALSTQNLHEIIRNNNVVFLLDCPWLTNEDFEIKEIGTLSYFCKELNQSSQLIGDLSEKSYSSVNAERLDSHSHSMIKKLDSQYNRIMLSNTNNAGEIVRVFRSSLIKKIENMVRNKDDRIPTDLYIFSSESTGLDFSNVASYPLSRQEMYEGKRISIYQYCNYKPQVLSVGNDDNIRFDIRLWSVLKYTSIAFAYIDFKNVIDKCFGKTNLTSDQYFEIYRDTIITFETDCKMCTVAISFKFSDRINCVFRELGFSEKDKQLCMDKYLQHLKSLVVPLYKNIVFSDTDGFGDDIVRTAFSMNLYSTITDVNSMMFWYKYKSALFNKTLCKFSVVFVDDGVAYINDNNFKNQFFKDKRAYEYVLSSLENSNKFTFGLKLMLYKCDDVYQVDDYAKHIASNIIKVAEKIGDEASCFIQNGKDAIKEMYY